MTAPSILLIAVSSAAVAILPTRAVGEPSSPGDEFYQYDDGTAEGELGLGVVGGVCWIHVFEAGHFGIDYAICRNFRERQSRKWWDPGFIARLQFA